MAAGDHAGLIEACARLGDVSRGGDPHLWTEVLQYFGAQQYDCTPQVCVKHKAAALHSTCLIGNVELHAVTSMPCLIPAAKGHTVVERERQTCMPVI